MSQMLDPVTQNHVRQAAAALAASGLRKNVRQHDDV
jgi:hypothetical protein